MPSLTVNRDLILIAQNDLLSALIDASPDAEPVVSGVALRVLIINFTAIHTSAMVWLPSIFLYRELCLDFIRAIATGVCTCSISPRGFSGYGTEPLSDFSGFGFRQSL